MKYIITKYRPEVKTSGKARISDHETIYKSNLQAVKFVFYFL